MREPVTPVPAEPTELVFDESWEFRRELHGRGLYLPEGCHFDRPVRIELPAEFPGGFDLRADGPPLTTIGAFTYSWSQITKNVASIGRYCSIASGVVFGAQEHPVDWLSTSSFVYEGDWMWSDFVKRRGGPDVSWAVSTDQGPPIVVGNDVWIGLGAYIRRGVTLGDGCIVGAHAVVTRDVPPYAVVAGNPARIVRYRFDEARIERVLRSRWWDYAFCDLAARHHWSAVDDLVAQIERDVASGTLKPYAADIVQIVPPADLSY